MNLRIALASLALAAPPVGLAQPAVDPLVTEFPPTAEPLTPEALALRMAGKVFRMQFASGTSIRIDVRANGYMHGDASTGWRDTGRWQVKGSTWCDDWNRGQSAGGCNAMRLADGVLLLKRRSNGEIVALRE